MAPHLRTTLKGLRLRDRLSMIFKILSVFETAWRFLDDYLVSPLAKPVFLLGVIYAVVNWKVMPFAWHIRVFNGYYLNYVPGSHLPPLPPISESPPGKRSSSKSPSPSDDSHSPKPKPKLTIFRPTLYKTTLPPGEIDFSFHKSNSTYLTDLDIARGYHLYTVFRRGFYLSSHRGHSTSTSTNSSTAETTTTKNVKKGKLPNGRGVFPMLGGTSCTFKKEIKPFAKVEVWSRVLSWDAKWVYVISHFVKPGAATKPGKVTVVGGEEVLHPDLYATCISKVVFKEGRKTVPPEEFFRLSGLVGPGEKTTATATGGLVAEGDWDWEEIHREIEERRVEGMRLAEHVAFLDEGHKLFGLDGADERDVMAVY